MALQVFVDIALWVQTERKFAFLSFAGQGEGTEADIRFGLVRKILNVT